MQAVREGVRQCGQRHGGQQDIILEVDVAGATGGVSRLRVRSDAPDDPTTCIAQLFDKPCFEPFGNELFTVIYPYRTR